jgi:hypothetical protein
MYPPNIKCVCIQLKISLCNLCVPWPASLDKRFVLCKVVCLLTVSIGTLIHTSLRVSIQANEQK